MHLLCFYSKFKDYILFEGLTPLGTDILLRIYHRSVSVKTKQVKMVKKFNLFSTDIENMITLEVSALSCRHISVSFEHPLQESMSTIEIDLKDTSAIKGKLHSTASESNIKMSTERISKVLQRYVRF